MSRRISAVQMQRKSRKRQAVGRQNYAREDPEYAVGQRVQRGEAFGTIADVNSQSGRQGNEEIRCFFRTSELAT